MSEQEGKDEEKLSANRRVRHRKKRLYKGLKQQMEFYFSDANLNKDRFMKQLLEETPEVDLSVFLRFNKVKALTTSVEDLSRALANSKLLALSPDGKRVRRVTPVQEKENVDDCTIYVEQLPPFVTQEWLQGIFSEYGSVEYVSIPRFRKTGHVKGFAFVEFESPESASRTLEAFGAAGCCLPVDMSPEKLRSIKTFEGNKAGEEENGDDEEERKKMTGGEDKYGQNQRTDKEDEDKDDRKRTREDEDEGEGGKRRKMNDEGEEKCEEHAADKGEAKKEEETDDEKVEEEENKSNVKKKEGSAQRTKRKIDDDESVIESKKVHLEESTDAATDDATDEQTKGEESGEENKEEGQKKKKKNRRKSRKKNLEQQEVASIGLQIMSKLEWKHLRNKYLNLQWANMKLLKQQIRENWQRQMRGEEQQQMEEGNKTEVVSDQPAVEPTPESAAGLEFTPGVVVKFTFEEPMVDVKKFKHKVHSITTVKYVDVREGSCEACVRCIDPSAAQTLVESEAWAGLGSILSGQEEESYWEKIKKDRDDKINKRVKLMKPKERGRQKVVRKALQITNKHIHFDED